MSFDHIQHRPDVRTTPAPRIVGIDVTQLLRDIGEASARTNPVDLFGLCLAAQRLLEQVQANQQGVAR